MSTPTAISTAARERQHVPARDRSRRRAPAPRRARARRGRRPSATRARSRPEAGATSPSALRTSTPPGSARPRRRARAVRALRHSRSALPRLPERARRRRRSACAGRQRGYGAGHRRYDRRRAAREQHRRHIRAAPAAPLHGAGVAGAHRHAENTRAIAARAGRSPSSRRRLRGPSTASRPTRARPGRPDVAGAQLRRVHPDQQRRAADVVERRRRGARRGRRRAGRRPRSRAGSHGAGRSVEDQDVALRRRRRRDGGQRVRERGLGQRRRPAAECTAGTGASCCGPATAPWR